MRWCHLSVTSLHLELSFSHQRTTLKLPACGNLPVPVVTLTFREARLMVGPGSEDRDDTCSIFPGWAEKAEVTCHVWKHCLMF